MDCGHVAQRFFAFENVLCHASGSWLGKEEMSEQLSELSSAWDSSLGQMAKRSREEVKPLGQLTNNSIESTSSLNRRCELFREKVGV